MRSVTGAKPLQVHYGYADSESPAENEGAVGAARSQADRLLAEALRREGQRKALTL